MTWNPTTVTAPSNVKVDAPSNATLEIELLGGSIVTLLLGFWDAEPLIESVSRRGYFRASDGTYHAASQIRKICIGEKTNG